MRRPRQRGSVSNDHRARDHDDYGSVALLVSVENEEVADYPGCHCLGGVVPPVSALNDDAVRGNIHMPDGVVAAEDCLGELSREGLVIGCLFGRLITAAILTGEAPIRIEYRGITDNGDVGDVYYLTHGAGSLPGAISGLG